MTGKVDFTAGIWYYTDYDTKFCTTKISCLIWSLFIVFRRTSDHRRLMPSGAGSQRPVCSQCLPNADRPTTSVAKYIDRSLCRIRGLAYDGVYALRETISAAPCSGASSSGNYSVADQSQGEPQLLADDPFSLEKTSRLFLPSFNTPPVVVPVVRPAPCVAFSTLLTRNTSGGFDKVMAALCVWKLVARETIPSDS
jgi:hypothetical protein